MGDIAETVTKQIADSPSAEAIRRSWFGTLLGQATTAIVLVIGLLTAITQLMPLLDNIETLHPILRYGIYAFVGVSLAVVLTFSVLPATFRVLRERKLSKLTGNPAAPRPAYFRITPYDEVDSADYARPDGAVERALRWIEGARLPVLYLTGASGAGKSSLVNAGLLPALKRQGWAVVTLRGMGQPLANLTGALRARGDLYAKTPPKTADARALLTLAGKERSRAGAAPLLVVLDQFEEYLILDSAEERQAYVDFLTALQAEPIPGIRLLHVLREDYRPLLFQHELPRFLPGESGFELAPFTAGDAQAFLSAGPIKLDEAGYARLFDALDRIETTPGLYRPITLNMIGHVLEREGSGMAPDPARLIENYLRRCITGGVSRDYTRPLLDAMITPAGTRQPATLPELESRTAIPRHLIESTLIDLQRDGLVRPLSGDRWEISHDFIASLLGRITGKLRGPWLQRLAWPAIGLTLVAWVVVVAVLVPMWGEQSARKELAKFGFVQMPPGRDAHTGRDMHVVFRLEVPNALTAENFGKAVQALAFLDVEWLDLSENNLDRIIGIDKLSHLQVLKISQTGIRSISGIENTKELRSLDLSGSLFIDNFDFIKKLQNLEFLALSVASWSADISAIENLDELRTLFVSSDMGAELPEIKKPITLRKLYLAANDHMQAENLNGIGALSGLEELVLAGPGIASIQGIEKLDNLRDLKILDAAIGSLAGVEKLESLQVLSLYNTQITSLAGIDCTKVEIIGGSEELLATCGP